jgi:hypothetical protein
MQEIVANVTKVSQLIAEIASATQQAPGIAQASQAVSELDKATQQNAALRESTAASESLRRLGRYGRSRLRLPPRRRQQAAIAAPAKFPLHRPAPRSRASPPFPGRARASTTTTVEEWKEF